MSILSYKRLTIGLAVGCVGLVVLYGSLFWSYGLLQINVAHANEQTEIFESMRTRALQSSPREAAGFLAYAVNYYPSGSKQKTGSRLDRIVERVRERAVQDIIAYLRIKTGQDLGDRPEPWITKYASD